jgi:CPA2 family monovalent cation:H+ antiporter-2
MRPRGSARVASALVARGEFSILLAQLGVGAGLEPQLGPVAAAYVLLCAISAPLLARWSDSVVDAVYRWRPELPAHDSTT